MQAESPFPVVKSEDLSHLTQKVFQDPYPRLKWWHWAIVGVVGVAGLAGLGWITDETEEQREARMAKMKKAQQGMMGFPGGMPMMPGGMPGMPMMPGGMPGMPGMPGAGGHMMPSMSDMDAMNGEPQEWERLFSRGEAAMAQRNLNAAHQAYTEAYNAAMKEDSDIMVQALILSRLGPTLVQLKQYEKGAKKLERALQLMHDDDVVDEVTDDMLSEVYCSLTDAYIKCERWDSAAKIIESALEVTKGPMARANGSLAMLLLSKSEVLTEGKKYSEALRVALEAREMLMETLPNAHTLVRTATRTCARLYRFLGRFNDAVDCMKFLLEEYESSGQPIALVAQVHRICAVVYQDGDMLEEARASLEKALSLVSPPKDMNDEEQWLRAIAMMAQIRVGLGDDVDQCIAFLGQMTEHMRHRALDGITAVQAIVQVPRLVYSWDEVRNCACAAFTCTIRPRLDRVPGEEPVPRVTAPAEIRITSIQRVSEGLAHELLDAPVVKPIPDEVANMDARKPVVEVAAPQLDPRVGLYVARIEIWDADSTDSPKCVLLQPVNALVEAASTSYAQLQQYALGAAPRRV